MKTTTKLGHKREENRGEESKGKGQDIGRL